MTESTPEILRLAAFPRSGAGGNPAGVVLDAADLSPADRLAVAADLGYSETAFLEHLSGERWRTRYYSPLAEVAFCGHATIAASVALAQRHGPGAYLLETTVGPIAIRTAAADATMTATLTSVPTHTRPATEAEVTALLAALRWSAADLDPRYPVHVAFAGNDHPIVVVTDRERLRMLDYDYPALSALMAENRWTTVDLLWAEAPDRFHCRNPFPPGGVVEDPATGAAAAAFGGYLRSLGLLTPPARVTVLQGEDMGRPSLLLIDLTDGDRGIEVTGTATEIR